MAPVLDLDNARLVLSSSGTCCYRLRLKCVPTCYSSTTAWSEQTRVIGTFIKYIMTIEMRY